LSCNLSGIFKREIIDDDGRALLRKALGHGGAKASCGSRNQSCLSFQTFHLDCFPYQADGPTFKPQRGWCRLVTISTRSTIGQFQIGAPTGLSFGARSNYVRRLEDQDRRVSWRRRSFN
jgi:hypothetical protein